MAHNALIDVNLILDYLLEREEYKPAKYIMEEIFDGRLTGLLPASAVPVLAYLLERETKKHPQRDIDWKAALKIVLSHLRLISVTGHDALKSLENSETEDELIVRALKRVCDDAIVITRDKEFPGPFQKFTPVEFLEYYKSQLDAKPSSVSLLDLQREYRNSVAEIDNAVLSAVAEARYILGPQVKEFEQKATEYIGTKHAVGVASGTDALVLSLRALAIKLKGQEYFGREDLIITTPFTFTATGDAILRAGATPLFVDIDPDTFNIDINCLRELFVNSSSSAHIVGILPVHLYGQSCDMDAIMDIAEKHKLFVLEDVAQAFGGMWKGRKLGSIGTMGAFSFYPTKNLGGFGDGGLVTTNDSELAALVNMLLRHGGKDKYNVDHIGYNSRLDTLQAALLLVRLKHVDAFNEKRRAIAQYYTEGLTGSPSIQTPQSLNEATHVYHQYTIRVMDDSRDALQNHLKQQGIDSMVYYPLPLHHMKVFARRHIACSSLKHAEAMCQEVLSLPMEPLMSTAELEYVVAAANRNTTTIR